MKLESVIDSTNEGLPGVWSMAISVVYYLESFEGRLALMKFMRSLFGLGDMLFSTFYLFGVPA
jgi:hypothetical protein